MRLELFDYELPPERIAQTPIEPRDASRLLVVRADGRREHRRFLDLPELLNAGDLLVFNDTRVLPARIFGRKRSSQQGEGARVEVLLLQRISAGRWEGLAYPGRRLQPGTVIEFGEGLTAEVISRGEEGTRVLQFQADGGLEAADELLHRLGQVPLPPYIHERLEDAERYQTIYARDEGSAAAPTAGLHFTPQILDALQAKGVRLAYVTLHVGIATFRPIKVEDVREHEMHAEWYSVPEETARAIRKCTGRVVSVGTTTARCLESAAAVQPSGAEFQAGAGLTRLYVTPGYQFRAIDCLLTNFHMPKSSLLVLVSAFAGNANIRAAYQDALEHEYRFLSFGDAMFLERATP
ncbi:MAG: tRNA preQ1(34) S-adenosylmethionine ribosyltransferase-isomerase QueA [Actinomycetota bacterium]